MDSAHSVRSQRLKAQYMAQQFIQVLNLNCSQQDYQSLVAQPYIMIEIQSQSDDDEQSHSAFTFVNFACKMNGKLIVLVAVLLITSGAHAVDVEPVLSRTEMALFIREAEERMVCMKCLHFMCYSYRHSAISSTLKRVSRRLLLPTREFIVVHHI